MAHMEGMPKGGFAHHEEEGAKVIRDLINAEEERKKQAQQPVQFVGPNGPMSVEQFRNMPVRVDRVLDEMFAELGLPSAEAKKAPESELLAEVIENTEAELRNKTARLAERVQVAELDPDRYDRFYVAATQLERRREKVGWFRDLFGASGLASAIGAGVMFAPPVGLALGAGTAATWSLMRAFQWVRRKTRDEKLQREHQVYGYDPERNYGAA